MDCSPSASFRSQPTIIAVWIVPGFTTVPPGGSLSYRFTATRAGIWMYHCATMPMSAHIAAGLVGAVVIEPPDLPAVDRSYLLVQSEVYLGASTTRGSAGEVDATKAKADAPDAVVFNGTADQYDTTPLSARVGERVRFWVLDAAPNRATSFHVVGAQFDAAYAEPTPEALTHSLRDGLCRLIREQAPPKPLQMVLMAAGAAAKAATNLNLAYGFS